MRTYLLIFLFLFPAFVIAQDEIDIALVNMDYEKETVDVRIPSKNEIEKLMNDERFDYKKTKKQKLTWWDYFKIYIGRYIGKATENVMGYVAIFIIVFALISLLIKILGIRIFGRSAVNSSGVNIGVEDVNVMNFSALIQEALANNNYRLCIRFMYLKNLKALSDRNIINWNGNKTNYSYLCEINDGNLRNHFLNLTILFDYVWYGNMKLDNESFTEAYEQLDNFNKLIPNEE